MTGYVTLQLTKVAVPRVLFETIVGLTNYLRPRPTPAQTGEIAGQMKRKIGVRRNGGLFGQIVIQMTADLQIQTIGLLGKGCHSLGGRPVVRFRCIWGYLRNFR